MSTIAVIPGDGIGPEVIDEALRTLTALDLPFGFDVFDHVNAQSFLRTGATLSTEDFVRIGACDGVLLGAIGHPSVTSTDYARGVLLRMRFELDLYVNYRPARLPHDRLSPLRAPERRPMDCVIIRENTEGLFSGVGGALRPFTAQETAIDAEVNTYHGVSRILDFAFRTARREVCMVDKSNAVRHGGELWQRCWREAAARYPEIPTRHLYVDSAVMKLVSEPTSFDVIVANNSYGDILSDLAAELAGGLGTAASVNLNGATGFGLFEPVHGSAPDIAGRGVANPLGAILTAALLAEHQGHPAEAKAIRTAVDTAIDRGRVTPDLGGELGTEDAGAAVRAEL